MPAVEGTVTPEDVAAWLGAPVTQRVTDATDAAVRWAQRRRSRTAPETLFSEADTHLGTVLYAGLLFQSRATPQGFAGYDEGGAGFSESTEALYRARDLVGEDMVLA